MEVAWRQERARTVFNRAGRTPRGRSGGVRRGDLLQAILAVGAGASRQPVGARSRGGWTLNLAVAVKVGQAYLAENAWGERELETDLLPQGWSIAAAKILIDKIFNDFEEGRLFDYHGWRLSETEGRLFALLALKSA